ncbi:MAG TPA: NAD+ synthase [Bacteroidota bacterium]|jgi:NAD+ synthase|nr:NAD+ synthase [Bacteroidota bacterium]
MEISTDGTANLKLNTAIVRKLLVDFIRDETGNAGFSKGVVGVSGGVDSALVAYLAVEALGKENVLAVMMPYRTSSPDSIADAELVISLLGMRREKVDISPMVDGFLDRNGETSNLRKGNIMARVRMIALYDLSARENGLVIGTSNKTEIMLGYGTQHGDTACAINPIGDLYKMQVWHLAESLGVPKNIVEKKPTADLWVGQTDEGELGFSYKLVDQLLYYMIDERRTEAELMERGFEKYFIEKVKRMVQRNQFKRRPPVIAKVSHRTVNIDFRYPRDWGI